MQPDDMGRVRNDRRVVPFRGFPRLEACQDALAKGGDVKSQSVFH
jgi:hypothetical protein